MLELGSLRGVAHLRSNLFDLGVFKGKGCQVEASSERRTGEIAVLANYRVNNNLEDSRSFTFDSALRYIRLCKNNSVDLFDWLVIDSTTQSWIEIHLSIIEQHKSRILLSAS